MQRPFLRVLGAVVLVAPAAFANPTIVNFDFGAVPIVCGQLYAYQAFGGDCGSIPPQQDFNSTPGFGWTLGQGGSGLTGPNSPFNPPPTLGIAEKPLPASNSMRNAVATEAFVQSRRMLWLVSTVEPCE